jgi:YgiT-type zinc finger domain-containing protein
MDRFPEKEMIKMERCYFCKGKVEKQLTVVDYRWGNDLIIIKDVPTQVCMQCGEKYFDAEVSRQMEHIVLKKDEVLSSITVPVRGFAHT